ncbi:hypothetical protein CEUSTIGMA_g4042.t1 [Chlamydomonas eustigma]|uniref:Kinesin motor domain-containing protein n=1 Tax=Chlamydomonas eustigma TaxID=1157962 RepID=A0A250X0M2_9CHLO|nr:hypothetical protein CEUSTIGMA_g4042.t1 [Chlamydomonas eustigma]|eukprot:GAX76596.1 hypothetical protein CEUSTIGMA_g4042.t1 [Chlamydomonas eustigma]
MDSPSSPAEEDILVSRLIARIAELEEKLYSKELEASLAPSALRPSPRETLNKAPVTSISRASESGAGPRPSLFSVFKDGLKNIEWGSSQTVAPTNSVPKSDWMFSTTTATHPVHAATSVSSHAEAVADAASITHPVSGSQLKNSADVNYHTPQISRTASSSSSELTEANTTYGEEQSCTVSGRKLDQHLTEEEAEASLSSSPHQIASILSSDFKMAKNVQTEQAQDADPESCKNFEEMEIVPAPVLSTPLIINGIIKTNGGGAQQQQYPVSKAAVASDWLSGLFAGRGKQQQKAVQHSVASPRTPTAAVDDVGSCHSGHSSPLGFVPFNEKAFQSHLEERGRAIEAQASSEGTKEPYYRYVFDPADMQAEMEVTGRVRKAAAEALMEAQAKLEAAEAAQAGLLKQLEEARLLQKEVEKLRSENEQALDMKRKLEEQQAAASQQLQLMQQASDSLQQELESLRNQSNIWKNENGSGQDKMKQENNLLRSSMQTRLHELQQTKTKLAEAEAEKTRLTKLADDQASKIQWLQRINGQLENSASQLEHYKKASADFQERFIRERNVRRKLHDQLQVLKGNIRVLCRVRPVQEQQPSIITFPLEGMLTVSPTDRRFQEFEFDHVFPPEATQDQVYAEVSSLVRSCADGYNVCIFAYGQTGSGKTFTMEGPPSNPGINVRALQDLFSIASEEGGVSSWQLSVSMMEIYNEAVHDLLRTSTELEKSLEVSGLGPGELPAGMDRVQGLTWRAVSTTEQVQQVLIEGSKNRATAATALNARSSRSHALLSVRVTLISQQGQTTTSTINLVDLAGCERVDKSEVTGQALKEAQSINKSLSALGDVIAALQKKNTHIPFRNSKLTQVLTDSLSGSSKVLLVCNVSPEAVSASETISSLNFALRVGQVELGQTRKVIDNKSGSPSSISHASPGNSPSISSTKVSQCAIAPLGAPTMKTSRSSGTMVKP